MVQDNCQVLLCCNNEILLSVVIIVVGGVIYITSAGDEKCSEMGKNTIKYAIAGIVIALISLVIIKSLAKILV